MNAVPPPRKPRRTLVPAAAVCVFFAYAGSYAALRAGDAIVKGGGVTAWGGAVGCSWGATEPGASRDLVRSRRELAVALDTAYWPARMCEEGFYKFRR